MGLCCQATLSSFSLARKIFEHMLSAGALNRRSQNSVLMATTYPRTVADQELWGIMSCLMKHAMILLYPGLLPQGSWMRCFLMKFTYTACLNLMVSSSESCWSLDIFLSPIFPRKERLACDSAGRKHRLSAPCGPVGGWHSRRCINGKVSCFYWWWVFFSLEIFSAILFSVVLIHLAFTPTFEPIRRPHKNLARALPIIIFCLYAKSSSMQCVICNA